MLRHDRHSPTETRAALDMRNVPPSTACCRPELRMGRLAGVTAPHGKPPDPTPEPLSL